MRHRNATGAEHAATPPLPGAAGSGGGGVVYVEGGCGGGGVLDRRVPRAAWAVLCEDAGLSRCDADMIIAFRCFADEEAKRLDYSCAAPRALNP